MIDELDAHLGFDDASEDCMQLSDLDGFFHHGRRIGGVTRVPYSNSVIRHASQIPGIRQSIGAASQGANQ
jgi:hypothetical protein